MDVAAVAKSLVPELKCKCYLFLFSLFQSHYKCCKCTYVIIKCFNFRRINDQTTTQHLQTTEPQPSTSSTENITLSSNLKLVRQNRATDKKRIAVLKPEDKKRLFEMKRLKEVNFMIMPDAPVPKKKTKRLSPVRVPCTLVAGTPTVTPQRIPQTWNQASALTTQQQCVFITIFVKNFIIVGY